MDQEQSSFRANARDMSQSLLRLSTVRDVKNGCLDRIMRIKPIGKYNYDDPERTLEMSMSLAPHMQYDDPEQDDGYKQTLSKWHLVMFALGNTIGAGVFALTGVAAAYTGPSLFLGFFFAGMVSMATALVYAELASRIPVSGSAFAYIYSSFGELPAFIIGWNLNLRYGGCASALARGWTSYLTEFCLKLGWTIPNWLVAWQLWGHECSILTVLYIFLCTYFVTRGSQESNWCNIVLTSAKVFSLILMIVVAFAYFQPDNFKPFILKEYGVLGLLEGTSMLFFGYLGFDFVTTIAEEAKDPVRTLPASIRDSVIICMILYMFTAISLYGMAPLHNFNGDTAMAEAFQFVGNDWMTYIIYICSILGLSAACFTNLMSQPRFQHAMAKDGLFFKFCTQVNPITKIPVKAAWFTAVMLSFIVFFLDLEQITKLVSLTNLISYSIVNGAVISLRFREPAQQGEVTLERSSNEKYVWSYMVLAFLSTGSIVKDWGTVSNCILGALVIVNFIVLCFCKQPNPPVNTYRVAWVPLLPCSGIYANLFLCWGLDFTTWMYWVTFEILGFIFYFCYGYWNSKVNRYYKYVGDMQSEVKKETWSAVNASATEDETTAINKAE